jgi:hypothetical protein
VNRVACSRRSTQNNPCSRFSGFDVPDRKFAGISNLTARGIPIGQPIQKVLSGPETYVTLIGGAPLTQSVILQGAESSFIGWKMVR